MVGSGSLLVAFVATPAASEAFFDVASVALAFEAFVVVEGVALVFDFSTFETAIA